jgi:hypothetical protein
MINNGFKAEHDIHQLLVGYLLGLFFDPEDQGRTFF